METRLELYESKQVPTNYFRSHFIAAIKLAQ